MTDTPSWEIFDWFDRGRPVPSWAAVVEFEQLVLQQAQRRCADFDDLLKDWNAALADLSGDPCMTDWSTFRPLRQAREEAWSDWLAHFVATSSTGALSQALFRREGTAALAKVVRREDVVEGRRADVVIQWMDETLTHVEVKVGDQSFAKTDETAHKLEAKYPGTSWSHYILLPSGDLGRWRALTGETGVLVITWDDVAVALRKSLLGHGESLRWRMWAHGYCGVIEQVLLGHPLAEASVLFASTLERRIHQISLLRRGIDHG